MHPVLIEIGPFTVYTYGFFIAAAFLAGMAWAMHEAGQRNLDPRTISDVGFYVIVSAILGSRLLYVIINPRYFLEHPLEILMFWKGGLVFLGGAILATLTVLYYFRSKQMSVWPWADCFAPALALGQAVGRLGCLAAGCCFGKECTLPWAVTFSDERSLAPLNLALHPTQIYHSLAGLLTFGIILGFKKHVKRDGQLIALFFMLYAVFRFSIEFFRNDYRGDFGALSLTQVIALMVLLAGAALFIKRRT
ncbi:MAG: prolipoprotein diacylglyceryl transferase [Desulfovibrionales bacterium]